MKHLRLFSIAIAVAGLASVADAKPKKAKGKKPAASAKVHIDKATKAHKAGKFGVALTELEAAYSIDPQPKLLFAIAQVQAKLGDCPGAVDNYTKFLDTTKDKQKQQVVKQAIAACKDKPAVAEAKPADTSVFRTEKETDKDKEPPKEQAAPPPPPPTPVPAVEATPPAPPAPEPTPAPPPPSPPVPFTKFQEPPAPAPHHKPFYRDIIGDVLVLAGVGVGAYSFIEYRAATKDLDDAEHQANLDGYNKLVNDAHDKRKLSLILAGSGTALLGAGILKFALHKSGESPAVALVPTRSGGLITWTGGF